MEEIKIYQPPKFYGIRTDMNFVTHVSLLLSNVSAQHLYEYLKNNNIPNNIFREKTNEVKLLGLTIAYSYATIYGVTPYMDKESMTQIETLDNPVVFDVGSDFEIHPFTDPDGITFDIASLNSSVFEDMKKEYEKKGAKWHLGDFVPFIKINDYSAIQENQFDFRNLPELEVPLEFDRIRYMTFGETKV